MSSYYVFDATRNFFIDEKGQQVSLLMHIDFLRSGFSKTPDVTDIANNEDDLNCLIKYLNFPFYVFDSMFNYVGSSNEPQFLPLRLERDFEVFGVVKKQIDFFVDSAEGKRAYKGCVHFSDDVTTCGSTYAIELELFDFEFDSSFDLDMAEEAVLMSINEGGESGCFFEGFSYKLYDINQ